MHQVNVKSKNAHFQNRNICAEGICGEKISWKEIVQVNFKPWCIWNGALYLGKPNEFGVFMEKQRFLYAYFDILVYLQALD